MNDSTSCLTMLKYYTYAPRKMMKNYLKAVKHGFGYSIGTKYVQHKLEILRFI